MTQVTAGPRSAAAVRAGGAPRRGRRRAPVACRPIALSRIHAGAIALVNGAALARLAAIWWEAARLPLIEFAAGMWSVGLLVVALDVWRRRSR